MTQKNTVKEVRRQLALSQEELAHALCVSFATVNHRENGKTMPSKLAQREFALFCKAKDTKAADIDAAVFDPKAVNPNAVTKVDERTPQEIIGSIEQQGRIVSEALARLTAMLPEETCLADKRPGQGGEGGCDERNL